MDGTFREEMGIGLLMAMRNSQGHHGRIWRSRMGGIWVRLAGCTGTASVQAIQEDLRHKLPVVISSGVYDILITGI